MGLRGYIVRRILYAIVVIYLVATVVFFSVRAIPGDPVSLMLGSSAGPTAEQALREQLGLNQPLYVQYVTWLSNIARGDLGDSILSGRPVLSQLLGVAEPTLSIGLVGIVIATLIAIPTGIISAVRQYQLEDYIATFVAFLGISMPGFWIGILLIVVFGASLNLLPIYGYVSFTQGFVPWFRHVILPAIAVAAPFAGILMRQTRSSMQEVLTADYMRTARAKGLDGRLILFKHGLQNALIPVVTIAGILFALLLGGIVAVEIVFGYQGLGRLLINSIQRRDFPIVQGAVLTISIMFIFMNLLIDLIYPILDPRITYSGEQQ